MRIDRRSFPRLEEVVGISVRGLDMFGAPFRERAQVVNVSREGLCFLLMRPISAGRNLEFICRSRDAISGDWAVGRVVWVWERFDGYQLVGLSAMAAQGSNETFESAAFVV